MFDAAWWWSLLHRKAKPPSCSRFGKRTFRAASLPRPRRINVAESDNWSVPNFIAVQIDGARIYQRIVIG
jgi:hypothetical protein